MRWVVGSLQSEAVAGEGLGDLSLLELDRDRGVEEGLAGRESMAEVGAFEQFACVVERVCGVGGGGGSVDR